MVNICAAQTLSVIRIKGTTAYNRKETNYIKEKENTYIYIQDCKVTLLGCSIHWPISNIEK